MSPVAPPRPPAPRVSRDAAWRDVAYIALDFETTGLEPSDHVVSYGVVPVDHGRASVGAARHRLVRPPTAPSARSQMVHLLRPQDLADAPDMSVAAAGLRDALAGRVILAWFAQVEVQFLRGIFGGSNRWWRRRVIDVRDLAIAADAAPVAARAQRGYALGAIAERYGVPVADPHDALDDALVTAQLFLVLVGKLPGVVDPTLHDLFRAGTST